MLPQLALLARCAWDWPCSRVLCGGGVLWGAWVLATYPELENQLGGWGVLK